MNKFPLIDFRWTQAVEHSRITAQEQARSRLGGLKKNIALIQKIHADGVTSQFRNFLY